MRQKSIKSTKRAIQVAVAVIALVGWAIFGAYCIPIARLSTLANYPNPFDSRREHTTIVYALNKSSHVTIRLYDLFGYMVREWEFFPNTEGGKEGINRLSWDGSREDGRKVTAGGYLCQVIVDEETSVIQGFCKIWVTH